MFVWEVLNLFWSVDWDLNNSLFYLYQTRLLYILLLVIIGNLQDKKEWLNLSQNLDAWTLSKLRTCEIQDCHSHSLCMHFYSGIRYCCVCIHLVLYMHWLWCKFRKNNRSVNIYPKLKILIHLIVFVDKTVFKTKQISNYLTCVKNYTGQTFLMPNTVLKLGQGRYGQQPIIPLRYVFDTDLVDTIRIQCDIHVHDLKFLNQEFKKQYGHLCSVYSLFTNF